METGSTQISTSNLLVFLRTSEEAQNDGSDVYDFATPVATITDVTNAFDSSLNAQVFTVTGTGFPNGDTSGVSLHLDGIEQETLTVTDTVATFRVTETLTSNPSLRVYFPDGLPSGYDSFMTASIAPTLVSISPSTGSAGGTLITVTGTGFGVNSSSVNLQHTTSGQDICQEVTITGYGSFTCLTNAMEISSSDSINLKIGTDIFSCGNTNGAECSFEQLNASSPQISAVDISDPASVFVNGSGFPTSNYDAVAVFMGVESSSSTITDSGSIEFIFDNGLPVSSTDSPLQVRFDHQSLNEQIFAVQNNILSINEASIVFSTLDLTCSFQGGCSYMVEGTGLTSSLLNSDVNSIDMCGNTCVVDEGASDPHQVTCILPHIVTAYSASAYDVVVPGPLHSGTWTGTASDTELAKLIDGKNTVDMTDSNTDCHFQVQYKENHVGVLEQVKFFINEMIDKSPYVGSLVFQGSDDGATFTDLWTIDSAVHEGWNYHDFEEGS